MTASINMDDLKEAFLASGVEKKRADVSNGSKISKASGSLASTKASPGKFISSIKKKPQLKKSKSVNSSAVPISVRVSNKSSSKSSAKKARSKKGTKPTAADDKHVRKVIMQPSIGRNVISRVGASRPKKKIQVTGTKTNKTSESSPSVTTKKYSGKGITSPSISDAHQRWIRKDLSREAEAEISLRTPSSRSRKIANIEPKKSKKPSENTANPVSEPQLKDDAIDDVFIPVSDESKSVLSATLEKKTKPKTGFRPIWLLLIGELLGLGLVSALILNDGFRTSFYDFVKSIFS